MGKKVTVEIPDEIYQSLKRQAESADRDIAEVVAESLAQKQRLLSAGEARRVADKVVFEDLVGLSLSSGEPIWVEQPHPCWRVPYRFWDGTLLKVIEVDAYTTAVSLPKKEREALLRQVEKLASLSDATL
jgi:hypothetical protein